MTLEFSKVQSGRQSFEVRWKECVDETLSNLPMATSALYVKHFFPEDSKKIASDLVDKLRGEVQNILKKVPWMDESTREAALIKAKHMVAHIGYPDEFSNEDKIIDFYKGLELDDQKYVESMLNISKFNSDRIIKKYTKPINNTDWETHSFVAMVNAFYNPTENSIRKFFSG